MEVVLLGTGAADGWPNAFCRCDSCAAAAHAGVIRAPTSALLDRRILLDLGPECARSAVRAGVDLAGVRDVLVTHVHDDHCAPAHLLHRLWVSTEPLTLHGPPAVVAACEPWLDPAGSPVTLAQVTAGDSFDVGDHLVRVLPATHEAFGPAVLYDVTGPDGARLLYATDTGPWRPQALDLLAGARFDLVLLEETFGHRPAEPGHHDLASFAQALLDLRRIGCVDADTQVVAVHLSHHNPRPDRLDTALAALGARALPDGTRLLLEPGGDTVPGEPCPPTVPGEPATPGPARSPIGGILLAAGAGRRLGGPKALVVDSDGTSWLHRGVQVLTSAADVVVVVLGAEADAAAHLVPDDPRVQVVVADDWAQGMGASLGAGLAALIERQDVGHCQAALVHLVDLPDVTGRIAGDVVAGARARAGGDLSGVLARAAFHGTPGHPVLLGRRHWGPLLHSLAGDVGARRYLDERDVLIVECGGLATGADVDTPADATRCRRAM